MSAINSAAVGAGAAVALRADISIAAHKAGIVDGQKAERIGLVSLAVPDDELLPRTRDIAHRLAASSHTALAFTKRSANHWLRAAWPAFEHSLALEILGFAGHDTLSERQPRPIESFRVLRTL